MPPRIYHSAISESDDSLCLGADELRYVRSVLRLKEGDEVVLFDGTGLEFTCRIRAFTRDNVSLNILSFKKLESHQIPITLAQSLPKGQKLDMVIQKATELGVTRIIPFVSSRSIPRLTKEKADARVKRWKKIAVEASRQCGRTFVPEVSPVLSFEEMLSRSKDGELRLLLWEGEDRVGLRQVLHDKAQEKKDSCFIIIGPEGGFSWNEVERGRSAGFITASLGRLILRTETAPLSVLTVLQYEKGSFGTLEVRDND